MAVFPDTEGYHKLDPLPPPRKVAKPLTREEIQAILPKLKQFGYNAAKIPVFPPDPTLLSPIQSTSADSQVQDNSQQQSEILQPSEELAENEEISAEAENIQQNDGGEGISDEEEKESDSEQLTELESTDNAQTQSQEKLDLQAKLSRLAQFGYNGVKIPVFQPNPTPQAAIQPKSGISQVENNYQEKPQGLQSDEVEKDKEEEPELQNDILTKDFILAKSTGEYIEEEQLLAANKGRGIENLEGQIRAWLNKKGERVATVYNEVRYLINSATVAQRQAVANSRELLDLIRRKLSAGMATTIMASLFVGSYKWDIPLVGANTAEGYQRLSQNSFYSYLLYSRQGSPLPFDATMNCWEIVVYSAYHLGQIQLDRLKFIYQELSNPEISDRVASQTMMQVLEWRNDLPYYPGMSPPTRGRGLSFSTVTLPLVAGQIIFFVEPGVDYPWHVALSVGGRFGEIISISGPGRNPVKRSTISQVKHPTDYVQVGTLVTQLAIFN